MKRPLVLSFVLALPLAMGSCGNNDTKLRVTDIIPDKGDVEGGTYVHIHGNGFIANGEPRNAKVYFGSQKGDVIRFENDGDLVVTAPGGKPNETVDLLLVFEPGGELKLPHAFTFVEKNTAAPTVDDLNTGKK